MRITLLLAFFSLSSSVFGQIDQSLLVIGRTTGSKTFYDGNSTRIFGFAQTLGAAIDIPGPTLIVNEGDSIEIDFWNMSQGAPHTIHLHGLDVNQENDGVPALSWDVGHNQHGFYKFKAPHPGTYLYHCHVVSTIHVQAGMYGVIIVRPANGSSNLTWLGGETFDVDFLFTCSEVDTNWHTDGVLDHPYDTINPMMAVMVPSSYAPQYYLVNGLSDTQLSNPANYFVAGENNKVLARLVNVGYYGVRYIFPSALNARTVSSDGRPLPMEYLSDTVEVMPGERYGTLLQLGSDSLYPVTIEYFNLNTQTVTSIQTAYIRTSGLGIELNEEINNVISPNPSNGIFYSNTDFEEPYTVYTLLGEARLTSQSKVIDIQHLPDGMYILKYRSSIVKLIKR